MVVDSQEAVVLMHSQTVAISPVRKISLLSQSITVFRPWDSLRFRGPTSRATLVLQTRSRHLIGLSRTSQHLEVTLSRSPSLANLLELALCVRCSDHLRQLANTKVQCPCRTLEVASP